MDNPNRFIRGLTDIEKIVDPVTSPEVINTVYGPCVKPIAVPLPNSSLEDDTKYE